MFKSKTLLKNSSSLTNIIYQARGVGLKTKRACQNSLIIWLPFLPPESSCVCDFVIIIRPQRIIEIFRGEPGQLFAVFVEAILQPWTPARVLAARDFSRLFRCSEWQKETAREGRDRQASFAFPAFADEKLQTLDDHYIGKKSRYPHFSSLFD